jgi:hypothetical protein
VDALIDFLNEKTALRESNLAFFVILLISLAFKALSSLLFKHCSYEPFCGFYLFFFASLPRCSFALHFGCRKYILHLCAAQSIANVTMARAQYLLTPI